MKKKRTHERWMHQQLLTKAEALEEKAKTLRLEADSWLRPVLWYTVQRSDVGKTNPIGGTFLSIDVGKQMQMFQGMIQMENREQMMKRLPRGDG